MKKYIILVLGIFLMTPSIYSQTVRRWTEDFDGTTTFTTIPSGSWVPNSTYYLPGSSGTSPKSYLGLVPNTVGDTIILQTPVYNCSGYNYVLLRFNHICKVSPKDIVKIQYRTDVGGGAMSAWDTISVDDYLGSASNFSRAGFNAASYREWRADDSTVFPAQSWWKEEIFDLIDARGFSVQFRFMIIHGSQQGTQASYGWLIDNFELVASPYEIKPPVVEFLSPLRRDTIYSVGPHLIRAKVKSSTIASIQTPWLVYTTTYNGVSVVDSVPMNNAGGDSLWEANIPQFIAETEIFYSITGQDGVGNNATISAWYVIKKPSFAGGLHTNDSIQVGILTSGNGDNAFPLCVTADSSKTRQVYFSSELGGENQPLVITGIAFYNENYNYTYTKLNQRCYLKAVNDNIVDSSSIDTYGATLVYTGSWTTHLGVNKFVFDRPFILPAGSNLMVYWISEDGTCYPDDIYWAITTSANQRNEAFHWRKQCVETTFWESQRDYYLSAIFYFGEIEYGDNSVELISIDNPNQSTVRGGQVTPVTITIQNRGYSDLTSAIVNWSVNGVLQTPYSWSDINGVPWDFQRSSITIGNYTFGANQYDTLLVWISMPNGVVDTIKNDDTLSVIIYGCTSSFSGDYVVGAGGNFETMSDAINVLDLCGASSDVRFLLKSGTYNESWNFTGFGQRMGQYMLTVTSQAGDRDSVVLNASSNPAINFNGARNIRFEHFTVNTETLSNAHGFYCATTSENITITHCAVLGDTNTIASNYGLIVFSNSGTPMHNITVTNNFLRGSFFGIYTGGGSSTAFGMTDMTVDSNVVTHQCGYGILAQFSDLKSIAYNTIKSRTDNNVSSTWYALYAYYSNGSITANRILQQTTDITEPYGIYLAYYNYYNKKVTMGTVANNEIRITTTGAYTGIYSNYSNARIVNNSIHVDGSGAARGIYIASTPVMMEVKNNHIDMHSSTAYPLYLGSITYLGQWDINSNNYYAQSYIGYANGARTTLPNWQSVVVSDVASVKVQPAYIDSTVSLELSDYTGLECAYNLSVIQDIQGNMRGPLTTMGCYNGLSPLTVNLMLSQIHELRLGNILGSTDDVYLDVINAGTTTITGITINWSFNNTVRTPVSWTGTLPAGQSLTLNLGQIVYAGGINTVRATRGNITGTTGLLTDLYANDDTAYTQTFICPGPFNGIFTVGTGGDFTTIDNALSQFNLCGINGDVTLAFLPGSYFGSFNLANIATLTGGHKLTVTSSTHNANDVILISNGVAFTLNNTNNLVIEAITIDVTGGTYGVYFTNACTNVVIRDCRIMSSPTTTSGYAPIYKTSTGIVDSIFIINNLLDGGYYGIYFYGGTGTTNLGTNIWIDSNTMSNQYYYGMYSYYTSYKSWSHNTVLSRISNNYTYWYGTAFNYGKSERIYGNTIRQRTNAITSPYGMYLYSLNNVGLDTALVANNEIYVSSASSGYYGIYTYQINAWLINNTVYMNDASASTNYAIYVSSASSTHFMGFKNNILVAAGMSSYPLYISGTMPAFWNLYGNCYYAPQYIAYISGAHTNLFSYQSVVPTDMRSVKLNPQFMDIARNLNLSDSIGLHVAPIASVTDDINGIQRGTSTNMGAYHYYNVTNDIQANKLLFENQQQAGNSVKLAVNIRNKGMNVLTSARLHWTLNGVLQPAINWTGNLSLDAVSDTITLSTITIPSLATEITVFTTLPNGQPDMRTYNDTLSVTIYGCDSLLNGTYTVGNGGAFGNLNAALNMLQNCGQSGNVTFSLLPGYYSLETITARPGSSSSKRLTIVSSTGNPDDVIITSTITMNAAKNITLKNITVDVRSQLVHGINMDGNCIDVEIDGCKILLDPNTTSAISGIRYYSSYAGNYKVEDIRIVNNSIDGGYYGIQIYYPGRSGDYGSLRVDNNTITNAYYCGLYTIYYAYYRSISNNTIIMRNVSTTQYGINFNNYNTVDTMENNRIRMPAYGYGMYLYYYINYPSYGATQKAFVANNEIIFSNLISTSYGILVYYANVDILHNSVYMKGTSNAYGFYVNYAATAWPVTARNNIFSVATTATAGYPIYTGTQSYVQPASGTVLNYNNYHSTGTYLGYIAGSTPGTIAALRILTSQDVNSVSQRPMYKDTSISLELDDSFQLNCPVIPGLPKDIRGMPRKNTTNMGAYGYPPTSLDADLTTVNIPADLVVGTPSPVSVSVRNVGQTAITSLTIGYSHNGIVQTSVSYSGSVSFLDEINIQLGAITTNYGDNTIMAWIEEVNGVTDDDQSNDTLNHSFYSCYFSFSTTLVVGPSASADFPTLQDAFDEMISCGMSGNTTLAMESGLYTDNVDFSQLYNTIPNDFTLTITSLKEHPDSVVFQPSVGTVFTFMENKNINVRNITLDATNGGLHGVQFAGKCTNIEIYGCIIKANPTATSTTQTGIYCYGASGSGNYLRNVRIVKNTISGGYANIYWYYALGSTTEMRGFETGNTIDSNVMTGAYSYGIYSYYNNVYASISHNSITSRANASTYYGMYFYNYINVERLQNNKITVTTSSTAYGIYYYYVNYSGTTQQQLVSNNEIRVSSTAGSAYGIYIYYYSRLNIYNNSIYVSTPGVASGLYWYSSSTSYLTNVLNNQIYVASINTASVPISHYSGITYLTRNYGMIDWNNYYSTNSNIAANATSIITSLSALQTATGQDVYSSNIQPSFIDPTVNLELVNYVPFLCPRMDEVSYDLNNIARNSQTAMGAYTLIVEPNSSAMIEFINWKAEVVEDATPVVEVKITNASSVPESGTIAWTLNGALQTPVPFGTLASIASRNIVLGNYSVTSSQPTYEIKAWFSAVNGVANPLKDTAVQTSNLVPLTAWTTPFVDDTIYDVIFDIKAKIRTMTGAPTTPPQLLLVTSIGNHVFYDTVAMLQENEETWLANIPQRYYGSKVVYSLTVSDTMNNTLTLMDSTYIIYAELGKLETNVIGRGTVINNQTPLALFYNYSWTRQTYLYREVCPLLQTQGTYITKIAWEYAYTSSWSYVNQTCYMRAVYDSIQSTTGYISPLLNGAIQVWSGPIGATSAGWVEITLDTQFFLPPNMNLEIFWEQQNGSYPGSLYVWAHTSTSPNYRTIYAQSDGSFPSTSAGTTSYDRPNIKITKRFPSPPYAGNNLAIMSMLNPVNDMNELCTQDYSPVQAIITNLGENDYDFTQDSITVSVEVINPLGMNNTGSVIVNTGTLESGESDTVEIMAALPIMYAGVYDIKTWVNSPIDNIIYDDTLTYQYISGRIGLPLEEDFSSNEIPNQFIAVPLVGSEVWTPYTDASLQIVPPAGNGMLRYVGGYGTMTQLMTRQFDLTGAVDPKLEFWYYHDSTASELDNSYTEVKVIHDGIPTIELTLFRKGLSNGWKLYSVDLRPYTNAQCVLIQFESMNKSNAQSAQYLGQISITSTQDLAVSSILISPEVTVCDLTGKTLSVVINNVANQSIDFSRYATDIAIEVPGYSQPFTATLQGIMPGNSIDTVEVASNVNIPSGVNTIKAYLTASVDHHAQNDSVSLLMDIQPALSVTVSPVTTQSTRINVGVKVWQEITIKNTGTVDISGIELVLRITGTYQDIIRETLPVDLAVGETYNYPFVNPYTVPADERYQVHLTAYMGCDSARANTVNAIEEYVDLHNLSIVSIDNPPIGQPDTIGAAINITVTLANTDDVNSFKNISIYAVIENEEGQSLVNRWGTIGEVLPSRTLQFTFDESYTVPNETSYWIRVYLAGSDNYPGDDTTEVRRTTVDGDVSVKGIEGSNVFTLSQNIPNPANNRTRINYSIPEAGEVVFHVHSVSGQLLYSETIEGAHGKQSIELNTSSFAAGIYFYSIEYKGQRLVKRMMVSD